MTAHIRSNICVCFSLPDFNANIWFIVRFMIIVLYAQTMKYLHMHAKAQLILQYTLAESTYETNLYNNCIYI